MPVIDYKGWRYFMSKEAVALEEELETREESLQNDREALSDHSDGTAQMDRFNMRADKQRKYTLPDAHKFAVGELQASAKRKKNW